MNAGPVPGEKVVRHAGEACGDAAAVQLARRSNLRVFRNANGQTAFADSEFQPGDDVDTGFGDQIAAGNAHVDGPLGTKYGDVFRPQKGDFDWHFADAGKETAFLAAKAEAGLRQ